ncbi:hypothetical protein ELY21_02845 [Legionella sp. km535]|uniref:hypothetical protein n=1 Tax=Legionella sp. km535 TaxID=2498107 RepID=UPI000F8E2A5F|nr:hypothetical protein [Legionella sp. km535]RUR20004.1 hypothetical protein ELY21_02845 [Legionella sp. km535]
MINSTKHSTPAFIDLTELYMSSLDDSPQMTALKNEWNQYKNKFGITSNPQASTDQDLLMKQDSEQDKNCYSELCSILQSGLFVEPGVTIKSQLYPNLANLIRALQANDDFSVIQSIAEKGIEKNVEIKEQNPSRDTSQIDKRITVFTAISQANSLEEALGTIKENLPELHKEQDAGLRHQ